MNSLSDKIIRLHYTMLNIMRNIYTCYEVELFSSRILPSFIGIDNSSTSIVGSDALYIRVRFSPSSMLKAID